MDQKVEVQHVFCRFLECILLEQDIEEALKYVTAHVIGIGMSAREMLRTREELGEALNMSAKALDNASYELVYDSIDVCCAGNSASVVAAVRLRRTCGSMMAESSFMQSASLVKREKIWRISMLHASPFLPTEESVAAYPLQFAKIPDRMQAQMQAKAFSLIGKCLPGGMASWYLEEEYPIYFINTGLLEFLGYTREEFLEMSEGSALYFVHPKDRELVENAVSEAVEKGTPYELVHRLRKHDMGEVWVRSQGSFGKTKDGRTVIINVYVDITDAIRLKDKLKKAQDELEVKNKELAILAKHLPASILTIRMDDAMSIVYANPYFYNLYGYTPQQMRTELNNEWLKMVAEPSADQVLKIVRDTKEAGEESFSFEARLLNRDKRVIPVQVQGSFLDTQGGANLYCMLFDKEEKPLDE